LSKAKKDTLITCMIQEMCPNRNQGGVTTLQEIECKGQKIHILLFGGYITQIICPYLNRGSHTHIEHLCTCTKEKSNG
jgi:hypothetical protein